MPNPHTPDEIIANAAWFFGRPKSPINIADIHIPDDKSEAVIYTKKPLTQAQECCVCGYLSMYAIFITSFEVKE
ncbi:hypothetical protein SAMN04488042_101240 [Shimia aestuarii]|uniref:Uncharacterized protein n=1 Tax=Shimia aestuarii TaxID=254406 RepID=A0A1I4HRW5_9RHOB|nr:hypothetical protein SAMN04488042_101240 [Shimia aestuarii]